jgi:hypothetical protein
VTDELTTQVWTFAGRVILTNKKLGFRFYTADGEERIFGKGPSGAVIGGQYEVEANDTQARVTTAKFIGQDLSDEAKITRWRAEDRAEYTTHEMWATEKRLARDNGNLGNMTLDQIAEMMATALPSRRHAMVALVMSHIGVR